jgi:hypothetical protein
MARHNRLREVDVTIRIGELREEFFRCPTASSLRHLGEQNSALLAAAIADVEVEDLERLLVIARTRAERATHRLQRLADELDKPAPVLRISDEPEAGPT